MEAFNHFVLDETPKNDIKELLDVNYPWIKSNKKIYYLNIPCSFDIEVTSGYNELNEKYATMYCFILGINGRIIRGRSWDDLKYYLDEIKKFYILDKEHRIIIYVHNLSYELQFMRRLFKWDKIFSLKEREPVYALTDDGFEFRCSFVLSGYKLENLANNCVKYPIQKMVGDLDYSLYRHCETPLTPKEWKYVDNDGLIVMSYIQQCIENERNNISEIPLTKTGYVRRYCRNKCLYPDGKNNSHQYLQYRKNIKCLTINGLDEYALMKRAYIGAHSHANPWAVGEVFKNVHTVDFNSSYPYSLCAEMYPMSKGRKIKIKNRDDFEEKINKYCCIFDITFYNIESTFIYEHFIPVSKCVIKENAKMDNGKIISASRITMSLTNIDFQIIQKFYKWESIGVSNFYIYMKGYLPKELILSILHIYKGKTELKGLKDMIIEYFQKKADLNATYGMMVTDICRDEIIYDEDSETGEEWTHQHPDYEKEIDKYNKSKNRFLFYAWGMFCTSYSKLHLSTGIEELKEDYLYSDTDSLKFLNYDKHKKYIDSYNKEVYEKLLKMCKFYHLNPELIKPKTIEGKSKILGVWDYEGVYTRFKVLRSKTYMYEYDEETEEGIKRKISFTVAGCNSELAIPYMQKLANEKNCDIFDLFDDGLYIPPEATKKNIHTYIDYPQDGIMTDYLGVSYEYHEKSSVHLEACDFTLSLTENFINYLLGLRGIL